MRFFPLFEDAPPPPPPATLTQEQVNSILAAERAKFEENNRKLVAEIENLTTKTKLTQKERDELESRVKNLQNEFLSKEEIANRERADREKQMQAKLAEMENREKQAITRLATTSIQRELTDAAIKHEAFNPTQIVSILGQRSEFREIIAEDGKSTGDFKVIVKFDDKTKDGNPIVIELDPAQAVKRLREDQSYHNLFKGAGTGGTGGNNRGGSEDMEAILKDPAKYLEWRQKNPTKVGRQ